MGMEFFYGGMEDGKGLIDICCRSIISAVGDAVSRQQPIPLLLGGFDIIGDKSYHLAASSTSFDKFASI